MTQRILVCQGSLCHLLLQTGLRPLRPLLRLKSGKIRCRDQVGHPSFFVETTIKTNNPLTTEKLLTILSYPNDPFLSFLLTGKRNNMKTKKNYVPTLLGLNKLLAKAEKEPHLLRPAFPAAWLQIRGLCAAMSSLEEQTNSKLHILLF